MENEKNTDRSNVHYLAPRAPQAPGEPHAFGDGLAIGRRYSDLHQPRQQGRA
jgi:hypothetical protein